jgi:hypothetical protein
MQFSSFVGGESHHGKLFGNWDLVIGISGWSGLGLTADCQTADFAGLRFCAIIKE